MPGWKKLYVILLDSNRNTAHWYIKILSPKSRQIGSVTLTTPIKQIQLSSLTKPYVLHSKMTKYVQKAHHGQNLHIQLSGIPLFNSKISGLLESLSSMSSHALIDNLSKQTLLIITLYIYLCAEIGKYRFFPVFNQVSKMPFKVPECNVDTTDR